MDYDVVVAGAGPVGLMLACELRLAGVDVLVVERLTEPDLTIKAGSINLPTAEALYRRGLAPTLQEHQQRMLQQFARPAGAPAPAAMKRPPIAGHFGGILVGADNVDFTDPEFRDAGPASSIFLIMQQTIEQVLAERAAELGVDVRRGVELTTFTTDDDGVRVVLGEEEVSAGWLVGCDGGRSIVRKLAGFDFVGTDPEITGHQAMVELEGAENLTLGWNSTDTGIYAYGPIPGRILTVEFDGPPIDRDAPITAAELEASLRNVTGADVTITKVITATRFTDNARQATTYRLGRVLLAGDAAHVHSPFGGQGLNLGIGDAVNLGWKLAATIQGWAPDGLLDTYTTERHPIGEWVLDWTRAQITIMRTDRHARALRPVVADLLNTPDGATYLAKKLSGAWQRYDFGSDNDLVGTSAPDLEFADGTRLGDHLRAGKPVLFNLADSPQLRDLAAPWSDRLHLVDTKPAAPGAPAALLIRPDGHIAWTTDNNNLDGLATALHTWLGQPA
ncbi:2-polyprenyl-6-methoxyphenol hydroxylase-like FAD-dependent oxidoreductase [Kribbella rubisoli]|uniref:2-polyprenyl-6-methoxyphenol hydroxylase-like FAD-dependent oxidoreductase n=1 Tax=Kribbella rubisoli TaxID=3075929 RepID=A0A4Q7WY57_9ACTN|nr:FAD-dependent monooxygenase [Kribbella rubisoli]RZU14279.1 2-polyprenyl-6-methoxyphenol hydroxylase-like FAD-dependent oxidoreductase [Kribbella rubisoli]